MPDATDRGPGPSAASNVSAVRNVIRVLTRLSLDRSAMEHADPGILYNMAKDVEGYIRWIDRYNKPRATQPETPSRSAPDSASA